MGLREQSEGKALPVALDAGRSALWRAKTCKISVVWLGPPAPNNRASSPGADEVLTVTDERLTCRDELLYPQVLAAGGSV